MPEFVSEFAPSQDVKNSDPKKPTPKKITQKPPGNTTDSPIEYASFGRRFVAVIVDGIILAIINTIISLPLGFMSFLPGQDVSISIASVLIQIINFLISIAYPLYFIGKKGQTPGKMALGIKVIKKDIKDVPGYTGAFLREFVGKILSAIPLGLGFFWMLWDKEKQTWHDKIAGTIVVRVGK